MVNRDIEIYMDQLSERPFFKIFSAEDVGQIKNESLIRQYNKGQIIFYEHDPKNYYYFVLQGLIKIEKLSFDGDLYYFVFVDLNSFFFYSDLLRVFNHQLSVYVETYKIIYILTNHHLLNMFFI